MPHPLDDARSKLKRARQHLANLRRQVTRVRRNPRSYRVLVDYDAEEGHHVVYSERDSEAMHALGLILGDMIHGARGALDFTIWQLATKHGGAEPTEEDARFIQFPVTFSVNQFAGQRVRPFLSVPMWEELERHQPHPGNDKRNRHLTVLHWISNRDKHRLVLPIWGVVTHAPLPKYIFTPPLPEGTVRDVTLLDMPEGVDITYKGDPDTIRLGRVTLPSHLCHTKIEVDCQPSLDVLFSGPKEPVDLAELKALLDHVERVVSSFDRFL